ncbi:MAG: Arm DNA-binding domain-containing protein, partial [Flammeovirgaceae bacterium]|nr:Arm DNA-binding domain-containing protein [Flammeovirgaceae bacterium]
MRQTISVKFFARKDRAKDDGLVPVFMRIGIGLKRINIITKIYVKPADWSVQNCKLKTNNEESRRINKMLEGFKLKAFDHQRELMTEGKEITLDNLKAKWYGTSIARPRMLMEVFKQHNEQMEALVNREFSPLTLERYETS